MKKNNKLKIRDVDHDSLTILRSKTKAAPSPDEARLETFTNTRPGRNYWVRFSCPEFTSLCPITGQPDFGTIIIEYVPGKLCVESKSLKLYLLAFRNHGTFHEEATNRILDDLISACKPRKARVIGNFNTRGGIAITVTAEHC